MKTLLITITVSVTFLGCAAPDKSTLNSSNSLPQEQDSNAVAICNAESKAYQPIQAVGDGPAGEILRSAVKDSLLIVGGGFGGEIVRAQQIKKNQVAREKILAECIKRIESTR